jgi:murein DD-endopeptidase MepM/ murein hydrolase activator NlpD
MHLIKLPAATLTARVWIIFSLILVLLCSFPQTTLEVCAANKKQKVEEFKKRQNYIEQKRKQTKQKIEEIKKKEYKALSKLKNNQYQLEVARVSLRDQQYRLSMAKNQLDTLESNLIKLNEDQQRLLKEAAKRIRQIYKGERLSLIHMVLGAKDISSFLDRLYYQRRMIKRDKDILHRLKQKTQELVQVRSKLQAQKDSIISSINNIERQKQEIAIAVNINKDIVNKLKNDRSAYEAAENQLARESRQLESTIQSLITTTTTTVSYATGGFLRPVYGAITSPYGWRRHPIFGGRRFHTGVDIAGPNRSAIRASNSGKVIYSGWYGGYGKVVIVDHGKSITTLYAHMSSTAVNKGQAVKKGQTVGYEGSTGYSTGPHLHFEVRLNGKHTNPMKYIK